MSRRKGVRGELEVARIIRDAGFDARRDGRLDGDLDHDIPDTWIEVKTTEKPRFLDWTAQAERDAAKHGIRSWAVVWRATRRPWTVTIPLDEYLRLRMIEAERE